MVGSFHQEEVVTFILNETVKFAHTVAVKMSQKYKKILPSSLKPKASASIKRLPHTQESQQ